MDETLKNYPLDIATRTKNKKMQNKNLIYLIPLFFLLKKYGFWMVERERNQKILISTFIFPRNYLKYRIKFTSRMWQ